MIKRLLESENDSDEGNSETSTQSAKYEGIIPVDFELLDDEKEQEHDEGAVPFENTFPVQSNSKSDQIIDIFDAAAESPSEIGRKSGLAWSAGIILFGSVAMMMAFGWFADLTFGSEPWGLVGGILIGAVIGFVQFFRTTAKILHPPRNLIERNSILAPDEENEE